MRLIDADELKEKLKQKHLNNPVYRKNIKALGIQLIETSIDCLSTINPVKHGKWIQSVDEDGCSIKTCSECGSEMPYVVPTPLSEEEWVEASDYCWHCSAKMDGK